MITLRRTAAAASLSLALAACNTPAKTTTPAATPGNATISAPATAAAAATPAAAAAPAKGGYEVKSGTVEMTNSMMAGMKSTLYFDDFGAKHATLTKLEMKMMGQTIKSESWDIVADGWVIKYDAEKKEGTKYKAPASMKMPAGMPDTKNMSEEMKKSMKELPEKEVAGKKCKGMAMTAMGMDMKSWSWKGIPLYTETLMGGKDSKPVVMQATSVTEGAVSADKFTAPADVKIVEIDLATGKPVGDAK